MWVSVCVSPPVPKVLVANHRVDDVHHASGTRFKTSQFKQEGGSESHSIHCPIGREKGHLRVPASQFLTHRFTNLKETLLNIFKFLDPAAFLFAFFSSQGLMHVKWNFMLILALASNSLSVFRHRVPLWAVV